MPVSAWHDAGQLKFEITFNMGLQAAVLNPLSFIFSQAAARYSGATAQAWGNKVVGTSVYYDDAPVDTCFSWSATPPDILSRRGEAADAIVNFPLT